MTTWTIFELDKVELIAKEAGLTVDIDKAVEAHVAANLACIAGGTYEQNIKRYLKKSE